MKVIDNFLSSEDLKILKEGIFSNEFPWYYTRVLNTDTEKMCEEKYNFQFFHSFYDNFKPLSEQIQLMNSFVNLINPKALIFGQFV